ncbi:MAG: ATP-grasp domain-containing protein [Candidatus Peribacteraceae bacterium]|nr:ATP-grasp domain-containing protein [Candidatus Peribacteraceae bacterium]
MEPKDDSHAEQKKTLLIINTGSHKKKFIFQKLKKLNLTIVVVHHEKNWAQPYADDWIIADTYNHTEVLEGVRTYLNANHGHTIDGAITFWEDDIPLLAKICAECKLKGNSVETATLTRDKAKMQERFEQCGLPHIRQHLLKTKADVQTAMDTIGFPAVIKPVFGSDSQFVIQVNTKEEAEDAYRYLLKNCTPTFDPIYRYNRRLFLYQEFVEGHEFSIECYAQHGVPHIVGIHEKMAMHPPFFMETGDQIPPRIPEVQVKELTDAAKEALIVLGVENSLAHVEAKLTRNGIRVIEVASRMGGEYIHENVCKIYDFDLIEAGAEIALGQNVTQQAKEPKGHIVGRCFIPETSGIITQIRGVDQVRKEPSVLSLFLGKQVGDSVLIPPDGFETIGWVTVMGGSVVEAEQEMAKVLDQIVIEVSPFRSSSSVGRTIRKERSGPALLRNVTRGAAKIEKLRSFAGKDLHELHVGIACNIYEAGQGTSEVEQDLMSVGRNIEKTLTERGYRVSFFDFNDVLSAINTLTESDVDIVFNVCERINDSSLLEPHAASILDILQIPYTGSNPFTLSLCIDKIRVKKLLAYHNIPTPKWDYAYTLDDDINESLRYPLIVKPANTDNSIGITNDSVVTNKEELQRQLEEVIKKIGSPALVEEYIEGDEYDVSIIGNEEDDLQVLPLSRSLFQDMPAGYWHIYPYQAKWSEDPAYKAIKMQRPPKNIPRKLEALISEIALDTYNILDCHDYGRVEIRTDAEGNPYVLELNPNPSINIDDCIPACAELVKMDYGDFIEAIMKMAIKRYKDRPPYYHLQTNLL